MGCESSFEFWLFFICKSNCFMPLRITMLVKKNRKIYTNDTTTIIFVINPTNGVLNNQVMKCKLLYISTKANIEPKNLYLKKSDQLAEIKLILTYKLI